MSAAKATIIKAPSSSSPNEQNPLTEATAFLHVSAVDAKFWRDVYSGLTIIAKAIYRRWIGGEPRCKHCKQVL